LVPIPNSQFSSSNLQQKLTAQQTRHKQLLDNFEGDLARMSNIFLHPSLAAVASSVGLVSSSSSMVNVNISAAGSAIGLSANSASTALNTNTARGLNMLSSYQGTTKIVATTAATTTASIKRASVAGDADDGRASSAEPGFSSSATAQGGSEQGNMPNSPRKIMAPLPLHNPDDTYAYSPPDNAADAGADADAGAADDSE
jgi:hypothetical protein